MLCEIESWKEKIAGALNVLAGESGAGGAAGAAGGAAGAAGGAAGAAVGAAGAPGGAGMPPGELAAGAPPRPDLGDVSFAMFPMAKRLRDSPVRIAEKVARHLDSDAVSADGGYINIHLNRNAAAASILKSVLGNDTSFFESDIYKNKKIMIEFSSPNTNKPLHLGHLRNDALGMAIARILKACGACIQKVCIINDRGIHICKSMLAYMDEGADKTPESEGIKSDHFVGTWYVRFSQRQKAEAQEIAASEGCTPEEAEERSPLMARAREMLVRWEQGDGATAALWRLMNDWAVSGMKQTYERTGVSFDKYYFESTTYLLGREEVLKGLENGVFYRKEDGSVWADLSAEKLDKKALLRKDGTSLYITQDFGTAIERQKDFPFDTMIYVVGNEQRYHFQVLFSLLAKLKFAWAKNLYHLAYGMVNLPEGRMKTREGTVVDADLLLDSLRDMAKDEIREKKREDIVGDIDETAEKIALGAVHYYLLQTSPERDMMFNPQQSLSFNGNTGPYLQYMGARLCSLLKKAETSDDLRDVSLIDTSPENHITINDSEWETLKTLTRWKETLSAAAQKYDPSIITSWVYELSKHFSRFYHDCPILNAEDRDVKVFRLRLCMAVREMLRRALELIGVPFLETM
ncbi:MAG: arginine--tRNA ligase [Spirochaetaceae bacterium]|jgi:arginyl-tRNA synthetase|nr:arginine--tRNA ligase [Spirochaetaceae bacterium]